MLRHGRILLLSLTLLIGMLGSGAVDDGLSADSMPAADYAAIDMPRLAITVYRGGLALDGHSASRSQERRLLRSADRFFRGVPRSVRFRPLGTAPDYWASASIALLESLSATLSADALLTAEGLRIRGVSTGGWHDALLHLRAALPEFIEFDIDMIIADDSVNAHDLCARAFAGHRHGAVNFEESTTVLRSAAKLALDRVISLADACRGSIISIAGHTDSSGPEAWNRQLSLARADAVADYLARGGIPRERLATRGAGSSQPLASNASRYGRSLNRRIDIEFQPMP